MTDALIGASLAKHLSPFLFPTPGDQPARHDLREAFANLLEAQVELNSFVAQSANAFSYDHSIEFVQVGERLDIRALDAATRVAWDRNGRKLAASWPPCTITGTTAPWMSLWIPAWQR